jgi:hypothetical protein
MSFGLDGNLRSSRSAYVRSEQEAVAKAQATWEENRSEAVETRAHVSGHGTVTSGFHLSSTSISKL